MFNWPFNYQVSKNLALEHSFIPNSYAYQIFPFGFNVGSSLQLVILVGSIAIVLWNVNFFIRSQFPEVDRMIIDKVGNTDFVYRWYGRAK